MRFSIVAVALAGALLLPSTVDARPSRASKPARVQQVPVCICRVYARYVSWVRWNKWVDSKKGLRGNHQAGDSIKTRVKTLADDGKEKSEEGCKANEFMQKVCRSFKACVAAAGGVLYLEWIQGDKDFWSAEKDAQHACEAAIVTTWFLS